MASQNVNIQLKMNNGDIFYVGQEQLTMGGLPQEPHSFIRNAIRGSFSSMLHVFTAANNGGTEAWVNPLLISSFTVTYS